MAESAEVAPTWRSSFPAMGTRVDIIGWGGDGMAIVNAVVGVVARHEDMWSVFRPSSEVSRLNGVVASTGGGGGASRCLVDSAQGGPGLVVSEETDRLLRDALAALILEAQLRGQMQMNPAAATAINSAMNEASAASGMTLNPRFPVSSVNGQPPLFGDAVAGPQDPDPSALMGGGQTGTRTQ